jgi:hypothetical protein
MAILNFFKKHPPILFRCSECQDEKTVTRRQLRLIAKLCPQNPICPFLIPCPSCHIGFFAPVDYADDQGHRFLFDQIQSKLKNIDPATVMNRIFVQPDTHTTYSFKFEG